MSDYYEDLAMKRQWLRRWAWQHLYPVYRRRDWEVYFQEHRN